MRRAALVAPVEEPALRDPVALRECGGMVEERPVPGEELRVAPAPLVHQFPERAVDDCLPDPRDLGERDVEVVEREQAFAVLCFPEFFGGMGPADAAGAGEVGEFLDPVTAVGGQVPPVLCIERIGGRVEQVAAHRGCEGEHRGVPGAEEVDAGRGGDRPLRGHHDTDEVRGTGRTP